jgi:hypothetical protein
MKGRLQMKMGRLERSEEPLTVKVPGRRTEPLRMTEELLKIEGLLMIEEQ